MPPLRSLVIWGGPVQRSDLKVPLPEGTDVLVVSQGVGGIGSNAFRDLARSFIDADGHVLPRFLESRGRRLEDYDRIVLAGFSAFHGFANEVALRDAPWIDGLFSLDACFSAKNALVKKGYVRLARRAIQRESTVVLTSSWGGGDTYSTGSACAHATFDEAVKQENVEPIPWTLDKIPQPHLALRAGNLLLLDYENQFTHVEHVQKLATPVLTETMLPILSKGPPSQQAPPGQEEDTSSSNPPTNFWIPVTAFVATSLFLGTIFLSRRKDM
mgnify:CR=1 FL=1